MNPKELLNIKNQYLDYRIPTHKLLIDIVTEFHNGPKLLQDTYIFSVRILNDDMIYVEYSDYRTQDRYACYPDVNFPKLILDSDNPVKMAKILGLNNRLSKTVKRLTELEQDLLALELQKQQIEQELIENAY